MGAAALAVAQVEQPQPPGGRGVLRIVLHEVPRFAVRQPLGGQQHVDGRIVQLPLRRRAEHFQQHLVQIRDIVLVAQRVPPQVAPGLAGLENVPDPVLVDVHDLRRREARRHGRGQQRARRRPRHEREHLARRLPGFLLEFGQRQGRDDPRIPPPSIDKRYLRSIRTS